MGNKSVRWVAVPRPVAALLRAERNGKRRQVKDTILVGDVAAVVQQLPEVNAKHLAITFAL
jgi:hypothetical protein